MRLVIFPRSADENEAASEACKRLGLLHEVLVLKQSPHTTEITEKQLTGFRQIMDAAKFRVLLALQEYSRRAEKTILDSMPVIGIGIESGSISIKGVTTTATVIVLQPLGSEDPIIKQLSSVYRPDTGPLSYGGMLVEPIQRVLEQLEKLMNKSKAKVKAKGV